MTDAQTKIDELQQRADQTTQAINELEELYQQQGLMGPGETPDPKALAEDMEDLAGRLDIIQARLSDDTPDVSELAEKTDSENIRWLGDGIHVVGADALNRPDRDADPIPIDTNRPGDSQ